MVSRLKLLRVTIWILGILLNFFIVLEAIAEYKPHLLPWAKTHMFVILLGGCISSAALGIYLVFLFLYWDKYGSKINDVKYTGLLGRFLPPLIWFILSLSCLGRIGVLTKQAWLVNISDVGEDILLTIAIIGFILYLIYEKRDKNAS